MVTHDLPRARWRGKSPAFTLLAKGELLPSLVLRGREEMLRREATNSTLKEATTLSYPVFWAFLRAPQASLLCRFPPSLCWSACGTEWQGGAVPPSQRNPSEELVVETVLAGHHSAA